jgi:hypothetical protein
MYILQPFKTVEFSKKSAASQRQQILLFEQEIGVETL